MNALRSQLNWTQYSLILLIDDADKQAYQESFSEDFLNGEIRIK